MSFSNTSVHTLIGFFIKGIRSFQVLGGVYFAISLVVGAYLSFRGAALIDYIGSDTFIDLLLDFTKNLGVPLWILEGIKNPENFTNSDTLHLRELIAMVLCYVPCGLF